MIQSPASGDAVTAGWVAVWTASRAEKKVAARIEAHGIETWLPTFTQRRRWSDRWREVVLPLFPGYLFARASSSQWHTILRVLGVLTLVKSGDRPARLSDRFIATLRCVLQSRRVQAEAITAPVSHEVGDEILITDGPLAGLRGIIQETRSGRWLVVWIPEIGRGARFTIGSAIVSAAGGRRLAEQGSFNGLQGSRHRARLQHAG